MNIYQNLDSSSTSLCIFILFLLTKTVSGINPQYIACDTKTCGDGQNIRYPFYIENQQESFCGYPGFKLSCNNKGKTVLKLSSDADYIVQKIFYHNQFVIVSNAAVLEANYNDICTFPSIKNLSLIPGEFLLAPDQKEVVLLYNCNNSLPEKLLKHKAGNCSSGDDDSGTILAMFKDDSDLGSASKQCKESVVVPVDVSGDDNIGIEEMVRRGFVLKYWIESDCSLCDESGGKCGFDISTNHFQCYCPDRPHAKHCTPDEKDMKAIIIVPVVIGTIITLILFTFFSWRWISKRKAMKEKYRVRKHDLGEAYPNLSSENMNPAKLQDLPIFQFEELAIATNNFQLTNKLGQGGFGPVYRGKLQDGQEIAVKRLSKASGQGVEEFMNEVVVISKLQHRNLVRLLGCCIEGEEKMLIYEYMPNKSLDAFLFDPLKQEQLDWRKRFNIIEGISRGLLYLHRDSRLRIIHRDLKASNILLDEELNPKISDFGMAKIFEGNQDQANTARVVGTYGYMSPEYAMEGRFSEKSDVFSFGVLLLEIVSRRKNSSFYHEEYVLTLVGYAWKLWNENNIVALVDPVESEAGFKLEITRCINVGLLCVQELVKDRPNMPTVISMLNSEIKDLPAPKKPAFTERQFSTDSESSKPSQQIFSNNDVTVTLMEGR